jgi:hypothetical protein
VAVDIRGSLDFVFDWGEPYHVIASEAKQSIVPQNKNGLLRRVAPLRKRFAFVAGDDG